MAAIGDTLYFSWVAAPKTWPRASMRPWSFIPWIMRYDCHCYENRPFSFFVAPLISGKGGCCENTSWGRGGKLKLAVPVGLPAGWAHLVMSHLSPRLPRFPFALLRATAHRNDIEKLRSRGTPSMSLRGALRFVSF